MLKKIYHSENRGEEIEDSFVRSKVKDIEAALQAGEQIRESYDLDVSGRKEHHTGILPAAGVFGEQKWILYDLSQEHIVIEESDDLEEVIVAYETLVRELSGDALYDSDGNELPSWTVSDVLGVLAAKDTTASVEEIHLAARMLNARRAQESFAYAEARYQEATRLRQVAFAHVVDSYGRGGQTRLAATVGLADPTVKKIVETGRKVLAAQAAQQPATGQDGQ